MAVTERTLVCCESQNEISWGELTWACSDLKGMTKISSAILILRKASATAWTNDLDGKMNQWLSQYIAWLEQNPLALEEKASEKFASLPTAPLIFINPISR